MSHKFHLVIRVPEDKFEECLDYYACLFHDCTPVLSLNAADNKVILGTGKPVRGAWFNSAMCNFYLILDEGVSGCEQGVDHVGIEFDNDTEAQKCLDSMDRDTRFEHDPSGNLIWEIWSNQNT